ncbi:hypothetical protein [Castellaniella defragrans]|uniref:hypothetical protein n=1 Tax=Castellaniella defragrans TaxID=75697 RepID=UPI00396A01B5
MALLRDRGETLEDLAEGAMLFCGPYTPADDALRAEVMDDTARVLLDDFRQRAEGPARLDRGGTRRPDQGRP